MDWSRVPVFLKVVETGSFTAAAKALGVPKSSTSRGVAALEKELATQLLQRTTRDLKLTDAGRTFYERARGAMAALDEAHAALLHQTDDAEGVVRLTVPNDAWLMPFLIARFVKAHPKIHVDLLVSNRHINLIEEGVDLALRAGKLEDSTLVVRKISSSDLGLFAAPAYLKRRGSPRTLAQLKDHDVVLFRGRQGKMRLTLTGPKGDESVDVRGPVSSDDLATNRAMIVSGVGIGLLPYFTDRPDLLQRGLVRVLPDHAMKGGGLHLVMPSARYVPTRVRLLADFLAEHFAPELRAKC